MIIMKYTVRRDDNANGEPFIADAVSLDDRYPAAISAYGSTEEEAISRMKKYFVENFILRINNEEATRVDSNETIIWQKDDKDG